MKKHIFLLRKMITRFQYEDGRTLFLVLLLLSDDENDNKRG